MRLGTETSSPGDTQPHLRVGTVIPGTEPVSAPWRPRAGNGPRQMLSLCAYLLGVVVRLLSSGKPYCPACHR